MSAESLGIHVIRKKKATDSSDSYEIENVAATSPEFTYIGTCIYNALVLLRKEYSVKNLAFNMLHTYDFSRQDGFESWTEHEKLNYCKNHITQYFLPWLGQEFPGVCIDEELSDQAGFITCGQTHDTYSGSEEHWAHGIWISINHAHFERLVANGEPSGDPAAWRYSMANLTTTICHEVAHVLTRYLDEGSGDGTPVTLRIDPGFDRDTYKIDANGEKMQVGDAGFSWETRTLGGIVFEVPSPTSAQKSPGGIYIEDYIKNERVLKPFKVTEACIDGLLTANPILPFERENDTIVAWEDFDWSEFGYEDGLKNVKYDSDEENLFSFPMPIDKRRREPGRILISSIPKISRDGRERETRLQLVGDEQQLVDVSA